MKEWRVKPPFRGVGVGREGWRGKKKIQLEGGETFPAQWLTVFSRSKSRKPRWVYDLIYRNLIFLKINLEALL